MKIFTILLIAALSCLNSFSSFGQKKKEIHYKDCYASFDGEMLKMGNDLIERQYFWNNGNLISNILSDKYNGISIRFDGQQADLFLPNEGLQPSGADISIKRMESSGKWREHIQVEVIFSSEQLHIKRLFRIFPDTRAIQCTYFLKGEANKSWINALAEPGDLSNLENYTGAGHGFAFAPVMEKIELPGNHWNIKTVRFYDITDRYNNFALETEELLYRKNIHQGNLAILNQLDGNISFYVLKESPSFFSQLAYPGADFVSSKEMLQLIGIGVDSAGLLKDEWVHAYGFVTGFGGPSELETLISLRNYQKNIFPLYKEYEPVFITNTWGDRGQDKKLCEDFVLEEIEAARRLGSNYLQIDDGWQKGRSANSAFEGGSFEDIWEREGYWEVHPEKFPNGLKPVLEAAENAGVRLSIWFNPAFKDNYEDWMDDAEVLTGLYDHYGFRKIKIDGLKMNNKISEHRIRKMFDHAYEKTNQKLSYDLDITAHKRFGYHYFNEYGVYWVANRYTDWKNYYPYTTLRNLWLLSRYVPAEKLQFAFNNIWRNTENYPDDKYAPSEVGFDYAFATTMASQPMGFFETSGLPEEAFRMKAVVDKYMDIQKEFHSGVILPVGEKPSGSSWTGFQSVLNEDRGYLLILRELNEREKTELKTWLPANNRVKLIFIAGSGEDRSQQISSEGALEVELPESNSWVFYEYRVE